MLSTIPAMKPSVSSTSACRHCRYYVPEGRRGGHCDQLNVAVQSGWKACSLALPPFTPTWENLEEIMVWQKKALAAQQEAAIANQPQVEEHQDEPIVAPKPVPATSSAAVRQRALWM